MSPSESSIKATSSLGAAAPPAPTPPPPAVQLVSRAASPIGAVALSIAVVASAMVLTGSWERVRSRPVERRIEVTGSAKRRISSDLAQWSATISTKDRDRTTAYRQLHAHVEIARAYLLAQGFTEAEIRSSAATFDEEYETVVTGTGDKQVEKEVFVGFSTRESLSVTSTNVAKVEQASREITRLLEQGITVTSQSPSYFYTKLGELKIEMLAEASKDARTRAEKMIGSAGGATISKLVTADMGVINVNPANATSTSWDGNNDTSSLDKDILTIVHTTYALQ
jgi:hypothetical protein